MKHEQGHWTKFTNCISEMEQIIKTVDTEFHPVFTTALAYLKIAKRFYLPDTSYMATGKQIADIAPFLKSPFSVMAILNETTVEGMSGHIAWSIAVVVDNPEGIVLFSFLRVGKRWVCLPYAGYVTVTEDRFHVGVRNSPGMDTLLKEPGVTLDTLATDITDEALAWVNLCLLCNVENAKIVSVPPPVKLNKVRTRNRLPVLDSYSVIEIGGDRWDSPYETGVPGTGKRSHLRRGHFRRLGEDRLTWVRASIVRGSRPGFVDGRYHG